MFLPAREVREGAVASSLLATAMLGRAGFRKVTVERLPQDPFNAYFVAR